METTFIVSRKVTNAIIGEIIIAKNGMVQMSIEATTLSDKQDARDTLEQLFTFFKTSFGEIVVLKKGENGKFTAEKKLVPSSEKRKEVVDAIRQNTLLMSEYFGFEERNS